jgi:CPA1 family monovalent cation:H+ antiporter
MNHKSFHLVQWIAISLLITILAAGCQSVQFGRINLAGDSTPAGANQLQSLDNEVTGDQDPILVIEEVAIILLFIATLVGIVSRQLRAPYTLGLVVMGLFLTLLPNVQVDIPPNLILGLLVPPLIFEGAFNLNFNVLRRDLIPILVFAVPGVVLTMIIVGYLVTWGTGLPLALTLVFGAVVAASDPVAVIALFRSLGVPKRLQVILEGESLFNDGTAIVLFGIVITVALGAGQFNLLSGVIDFVRISGGGLIIGLAIGYLVAQMIYRIDDYLIETTLTTVLAYGSYLLAEQVFHVSGVLAVVAAGLVTGSVGPAGMSPTTRIVLNNFWEYAAFLANSFIFLLIGLQIDLSLLFASWENILIAILAVLAARALVIYGLSWTGRQIPLRWQHVLNWGGLRGAVSLALALSLPLALGAARTELQVMAFGVVVFTLLVPGATMQRVVRHLGLQDRNEVREEYQRRHARAVAVRAAFDHLASMRRRGLISDHTWQTLSPRIEEHNQALVHSVREVMAGHPDLEAEEMNTARRESLQAQRSTLTSLVKDGVITEEIYAELVGEIDTALSGETTSWPELTNHNRMSMPDVNRLIMAVIQEQDRENALSVLSKLGFAVTHLSSTGVFLGRRNLTLLIGLRAGQEEGAVEALSKSCKQRVEYVSTPLEAAAPLPLPTPMQVTVGGATIFVFEVERYEEI